MSAAEAAVASEISVDVRLWGVGFAMYTEGRAQRIPPDAVSLDIGRLERSSVAPPAIVAPPGSVPEAIYWRHPESDPPDDEFTVLLHTPNGDEPTIVGWREGGRWFTCFGSPLPDGEVAAWADMPAGAIPR